jgi:hypothetical protein
VNKTIKLSGANYMRDIVLEKVKIYPCNIQDEETTFKELVRRANAVEFCYLDTVYRDWDLAKIEQENAASGVV